MGNSFFHNNAFSRSYPARRRFFGEDIVKITRFGSTLLLGAALLLAGCGGTSSNTTSTVQSPVIMSPADGSTGAPLTVSFFWLSVNRATYDFQLSTDAAFSNITEQKTGLKSNSYTLSAKPLPETVYYWRVRAKVSGQSPSPWSTARFTTGASASAPRPAPIQGE